MSLIKEFQYPDGWYMRVGQVYSSPYESYHAKITRIMKMNNEEEMIYYTRLNPRNYSDVWSDEEERAYSWWFNQGHWDLEKEPETISFKNGSTIKLMPSENSIRGKQSEYFFGFDLGHEQDK